MSGKAKEPRTAGWLVNLVNVANLVNVVNFVNLVNLVPKNFKTRKQFDGCATEEKNKVGS